MELENILRHHHRETLERLDRLISLLTDVKKDEDTIVVEFDTLTAQVKANTDAEASAVILINGIAARIAANNTDPAAVAALAAQLKTSADALAAAVIANTPAAA